MAFANILYKSFYWRAIQMGSSFLQNILLARLLQSAAYAEIYSLVYIYGLVTGLFTFGLNIGLNYFVARGQLSVSAARRLIAQVTFVALAGGTVLLFVFRHAFAYPGLSVGTMLFFAACQIAGVLLTTLAGAVFTARERNHLPVQLAVYANGAMILLALADYQFFSGEQARQYLFLLYFLFTLAQGLALFFWLGRLQPKQTGQPAQTTQPSESARPDQVDTRSLFRFCFLSFITGFLFLIGGRVGIYLLPYRTTPAELGNYIQTYKLVEYLGYVMAFLYYPIVTLAAGNDSSATKEKVLLLVRLSNTLVLLVSLGGIVVGPFVFPLVFGPSFGGMYPIFWGFIPGLFALCSSAFLTAWYFGAGEIRYNLVSAIVQLVTALLLYFLLSPRWGVRGAAFAYSGGALASFAYDCWMFRRFHVFRLRDLLWIRPADWRLVCKFSGELLPRR
jgi:O-antigen/teichoic acid export membrane protein